MLVIYFLLLFSKDIFFCRHPPEEAFLIFSGIISVFVAITWLVSYFNADIMEIPQIMPKDPWSEKHKDKKWYTFEKPE